MFGVALCDRRSAVMDAHHLGADVFLIAIGLAFVVGFVRYRL